LPGEGKLKGRLVGSRDEAMAESIEIETTSGGDGEPNMNGDDGERRQRGL